MATRAATAQRQKVEDGSQMRVALVTFGPGRIYWERFGHNALWIRDSTAGIDKLYDYGRFSFQQENFLWRFIRGRMEYSTGAEAAGPLIQRYVARDRSVWVQDLNLSPDQRVALYQFLEWNILPANRDYPYHYFRDNCSTRIRDAIDGVVGGLVRVETETVMTSVTYRFHAVRLTADDLGLYTGLMLGLGSPTDRPLSAWEDMFIPMSLMEHLRSVTIHDEDGASAPLVTAERTVHVSSMAPPPLAPPNRTPQFLAVGVVLASVIIALGVQAPKHAAMRVAFATTASLWSLLSGLLGATMVFLWAFTNHDTSYWNENLFFLTPIALPSVLLIPLAVFGRRWATRPTVLLSVAVGVSATLGFVLQVLPWFNQVNGPVIGLAMPVDIAILVGMIATLGARRTTVTAPS
jgi:Domain of unknown function (DUF4105)